MSTEKELLQRLGLSEIYFEGEERIKGTDGNIYNLISLYENDGKVSAVVVDSNKKIKTIKEVIKWQQEK